MTLTCRLTLAFLVIISTLSFAADRAAVDTPFDIRTVTSCEKPLLETGLAPSHSRRRRGKPRLYGETLAYGLTVSAPASTRLASVRLASR
jgi:hypothetical protein